MYRAGAPGNLPGPGADAAGKKRRPSPGCRSRAGEPRPRRLGVGMTLKAPCLMGRARQRRWGAWRERPLRACGRRAIEARVPTRAGRRLNTPEVRLNAVNEVLFRRE